jgi:hypothetical protein
VLALCVSGITAVSMQIRCVDAAREVARLAARGDGRSDGARAMVPDGAVIQLRREDELFIVTVSARSVLLPGVTVAARAVAAAEPGVR